jgi:hypothetical protein
MKKKANFAQIPKHITMIIANPIYDVVFKYLLEDIEIARELLSTILGEEIVSLNLRPQEAANEDPMEELRKNLKK